MLPATQTSTESKISSSLHELGGEREQSEVFQSNNELSDSNDTQNLTEHRSAQQQDLGNRDNSVKRDTVKSFLRGENNVLFCFLTIQFVFNYTRYIFDKALATSLARREKEMTVSTFFHFHVNLR